jgi:sugar-specific transcriptional regulator TrmB
MNEKEMLKEVGLTDSEAKVYLALLKIGNFTSKGAILKESKVAPSKVYHLLDKLMEKGLASSIIRNNVKHFAAAPPSRINDYIQSKQKRIEEEVNAAEALLPRLDGLYKSFTEKATAEVFFGWKGMETVYSTLLKGSGKGQTVLVLGASQGTNPEKTKRFFSKYSQLAKSAGMKVKVIFNEGARDYCAEIENEMKSRLNKRFLFKTAPVEVLVTKEVTAIVMLKEDPIVILIRDRETAQSFMDYFDELWKISKE